MCLCECVCVCVSVSVTLTSLGNNADVLLDLLALGGSDSGRSQLGEDVVRDGGNGGAQVGGASQVTGGELQHGGRTKVEP